MTISCVTCGREHDRASLAYAEARWREQQAERRQLVRRRLVNVLIVALGSAAAATSAWLVFR